MSRIMALFAKQTVASFFQVCAWQCLQIPKNSSSVNTTAVCIAPSNETVAQATLTLLEFFRWRRALTLTDSTTPQEVYNVSHIF